MDRTAWIEHRRGDGELVGWMRVVGDDFQPIDLLGRDVSEPVDWFTAEETLDELGIGYLADPFTLTVGEREVRVRITQVSTDRILVKKDDYGDITASLEEFRLAWPIPAELRPLK